MNRRSFFGKLFGGAAAAAAGGAATEAAPKPKVDEYRVVISVKGGERADERRERLAKAR